MCKSSKKHEAVDGCSRICFQFSEMNEVNGLNTVFLNLAIILHIQKRKSLGNWKIERGQGESLVEYILAAERRERRHWEDQEVGGGQLC